MGYIAFMDGSNWTVTFDNDGHPHLSKSVIHCAACDDDRVLKTGFCYKCQEILDKK
jgi:hypothetical protein